jgi:hypothetical protein
VNPQDATSSMWRIVDKLSRSFRQLVYRASYDGRRDSAAIELALISEGAYKTVPGPPNFTYYAPEKSVLSVADPILRHPWIEAAVYFIIHFEKNEVYVDLFNRDLSQRPQTVEEKAAKSKPAALLMCFALSMSARLLQMHGPQNDKPAEVSLLAADEGDGALVKYYSEHYGLSRIGPDSAHMRGLLEASLQKCHSVWSRKSSSSRAA